MNGSCQVCGESSKNYCANCRIFSFCCEEHQKQGWPTHKTVCRSVPFDTWTERVKQYDRLSRLVFVREPLINMMLGALLHFIPNRTAIDRLSYDIIINDRGFKFARVDTSKAFVVDHQKIPNDKIRCLITLGDERCRQIDGSLAVSITWDKACLTMPDVRDGSCMIEIVGRTQSKVLILRELNRESIELFERCDRNAEQKR